MSSPARGRDWAAAACAAAAHVRAGADSRRAPVHARRGRGAATSALQRFAYESFHAVYGIPPPYKPRGWDDRDDLPRTFELQIRTLFQHAYAEPQHGLAYKPETPPSDQIRRELAWVASSWGADQALERVRTTLAQRDQAGP